MGGTTKTYGLGGGVAGTSEIEDDLDPSVLIESADGADYVTISTVNGSEKIQFGQNVILPDGDTNDPSLFFTTNTHTPTGMHYHGGGIAVVCAGGRVWHIATNHIQRYDVTGGVHMSGTASSATSPIYAFNQDDDTGVGRAAADALSLTAGGVEGVRITEAGGAAVVKINDAVQYNLGTGTDTATTEPVYLADTNATLIIDFANGNFGDVTLAAGVTAVKFFNVPADGTVATVTARITQDSSTRTVDYSDSAVTCYQDGGSLAITGEIKFSGGVHHTQSTGSGAVDLVSFSAFGTDGTATAITGATQDDNDPTPCTITSNGHGLANGERVTIAGVVGMTELNGNTYTVVGVTTNTFGLTGVDASEFTAYGSGGTFTLHIGNIYAAVVGQAFA